jgi:hypothetical protein
MNYLSFRFYFSFEKKAILISAVVIRILLLYLLGYLVLYKNNQIDVILFLIFYIIVTSIYDYYLLISKNIKYDSFALYIERGKNWEEIQLKFVTKIKRTFFYFYTINYKIDDNLDKKVIFYISPNPPFCRPKKINEIISYIQYENI